MKHQRLQVTSYYLCAERFSELDLVFEVKVQARCDECDRVILFEMGEFPCLWNRFLW